MNTLNRISQRPDVMGGKACIGGQRVTVGMIVGQIATDATSGPPLGRISVSGSRGHRPSAAIRCLARARLLSPVRSHPWT